MMALRHDMNIHGYDVTPLLMPRFLMMLYVLMLSYIGAI